MSQVFLTTVLKVVLPPCQVTGNTHISHLSLDRPPIQEHLPPHINSSRSGCCTASTFSRRTQSLLRQRSLLDLGSQIQSRITNLEVSGVYSMYVILSTQSKFQPLRDSSGYQRHHSRSTFALFSEIQHLLIGFCNVSKLDYFEFRLSELTLRPRRIQCQAK